VHLSADGRVTRQSDSALCSFLVPSSVG
jgi:hypothetical protein